MTCETATLLLHFARPSEMGAEDRAALDAHTAACPACASFLNRHSAEDAAIAKAMTAVTIPVGFRDALQNRAISVQNTLWWSKWVSRVAATAATFVFCAWGYGFFLLNTRSEIDSQQLIAEFDHSGGASSNIAFDDWRKAEGLPQLPEDFDLRFLSFAGQQPLQGRMVPAVRLQAGPGQSAMIYFVRGSKFDLSKAVDDVGSNGSVRVYRNQPGGFTVIIVFTGTSLAPFLHNPADAA